MPLRPLRWGFGSLVAERVVMMPYNSLFVHRRAFDRARALFPLLLMAACAGCAAESLSGVTPARAEQMQTVPAAELPELMGDAVPVRAVLLHDYSLVVGYDRGGELVRAILQAGADVWVLVSEEFSTRSLNVLVETLKQEDVTVMSTTEAPLSSRSNVEPHRAVVRLVSSATKRNKQIFLRNNAPGFVRYEDGSLGLLSFLGPDHSNAVARDLRRILSTFLTTVPMANLSDGNLMIGPDRTCFVSERAAAKGPYPSNFPDNAEEIAYKANGKEPIATKLKAVGCADVQWMPDLSGDETGDVDIWMQSLWPRSRTILVGTTALFDKETSGYSYLNNKLRSFFGR